MHLGGILWPFSRMRQQATSVLISHQTSQIQFTHAISTQLQVNLSPTPPYLASYFFITRLCFFSGLNALSSCYTSALADCGNTFEFERKVMFDLGLRSSYVLDVTCDCDVNFAQLQNDTCPAPDKQKASDTASIFAAKNFLFACFTFVFLLQPKQ